SAIWVHSVPEALTADSLQKNGHEVIYVTCDGLFDAGCISMSIYGINTQSTLKERQAISKIYSERKKNLIKNYHFKNLSLNNFIYPDDQLNVERIIKELPFLNFEYKIDDIKLGRAALYYIILRYKKINLNFSEEIWQEYLV